MDRIAILINDITKSAGTERAVVNLANALVEETSNKVYIISVYSHETDESFYKIDKRVVIVHLSEELKSNRLLRLARYVAVRRKLQSIIKLNSIDIIIGTIHAYNIILGTMRDVLKIGCEHLNYYSCPAMVRPIRRHYYKKLDAVVLLTKEDAAHYQFINNGRTMVIPNISSFKRNEKASLENNKIISVGRLTRQKGYDILIDVINGIKERLAGWTIEIYGAGEDKEKLNEEIRRCGLSNIIKILEPVGNIKEKMLDSSLYLMTSRNEGLPMALIEAQTCGLPIIAFDCPEGPREVISDGKDGFLISLADNKLMRTRIVELISDASMRKRFGDYAYERSLRFSPKSIIEKWNALFESVKAASK